MQSQLQKFLDHQYVILKHPHAQLDDSDAGESSAIAAAVTASAATPGRAPSVARNRDSRRDVQCSFDEAGRPGVGEVSDQPLVPEQTKDVHGSDSVRIPRDAVAHNRHDSCVAEGRDNPSSFAMDQVRAINSEIKMTSPFITNTIRLTIDAALALLSESHATDEQVQATFARLMAVKRSTDHAGAHQVFAELASILRDWYSHRSVTDPEVVKFIHTSCEFLV